jgi:hypothetical protein
MYVRGLFGRRKPFREMVVPPRPTATFTPTFAVAALGGATVLSATLIGMSHLGGTIGPLVNNGARILAGPQTPSSTFPFFGFGEAPLPAVTPPPEVTPPVTGPGEGTGQSNPVPVVAPPAVPAPPAPVVHSESVTTVFALHATTGVGIAHVTTTVVSAASAFPSATVVSAPQVAPAVLVVEPAHQRGKDAAKQADGASKHGGGQGHGQSGHSPKPPKAPKDNNSGKGNGST